LHVIWTGFFGQHTELSVPVHPACSHFAQSASLHFTQSRLPQQTLPEPAGGALFGHDQSGMPEDPPPSPPESARPESPLELVDVPSPPSTK
jgi:hypothetical protein